MDRDLTRSMLILMLHGFALAATISCQQGDRRESGGDVVPVLPLARPPVETSDAAVRAAQAELAAGRAWLATRKVTPALHDPERRTPEAVLVAARAAAGWHGWTLVNAMLRYEPWLDSRFSGEGHELLALSALERGEADEARRHAEDALREGGGVAAADDQSAAARGMRLVLLARALDRLDQRDSAAATYRRAADALPAVREWLLLRAAGSTRNGDARKELYENVRQETAAARIAPTEAQALERFGMPLSAADAYERLGDMPSAYRLRLAAAADPAVRAGLRSGLLGYIQRDARGDNLQRAIEVLDAAFPELDATTEHLVARRAAAGGLSARAASGFAKVPARLITDSDMIAWGRASIASGRPSEAARRIGDRRFGESSVAEARYVRGLAFVRAGSFTAARAALQRVISRNASTPWAADAMYLLADLESDAGRDARARDLHQRACEHKRPGSFSDEACFRSGILSFALGNHQRAATVFDALPRRFPRSTEVIPALYWAGRAWERAGNRERARERWVSVMNREPLSYYAAPAAKRLGDSAWTPSPGQLPRIAEPDPAIARATVLDALGMGTEERYEYDAAEHEPDSALSALLETGAELLEHGESVRAIRVGWRAVAAGRTQRDSGAAVDERGYLLAYPLLREAELIARSRANNLDPALVAAVIRQESQWNPRALSRAGARGLMQVMPSVGEAIARSKDYPVWDPALLFEPDVSLDLGTAHLRDALASYSSLPRALAAYNAGGSRVRRWSQRTGVSDPELFIERIPFVETRDYVRIVMRNAELYRALHGLRE